MKSYPNGPVLSGDISIQNISWILSHAWNSVKVELLKKMYLQSAMLLQALLVSLLNLYFLSIALEDGVTECRAGGGKQYSLNAEGVLSDKTSCFISRSWLFANNSWIGNASSGIVVNLDSVWFKVAWFLSILLFTELQVMYHATVYCNYVNELHRPSTFQCNV